MATSSGAADPPRTSHSVNRARDSLVNLSQKTTKEPGPRIHQHDEGASTRGSQTTREQARMNSEDEFERKYGCPLPEAFEYLSSKAYYITRNHDDAGDLAQDLLEKLLKSPGPARPIRDWKPYLNTALANLYLDKFIRAKPARKMSTVDIPDREAKDPGPEEEAILEDLRQRFWKEVDNLRPEYRRVILLRFCHCTFSIRHTISEIAVILDVPESTVARRLRDAMRILRKPLERGLEES